MRDEILRGVQLIPSLDKIYKQNKLFIRLGKKYLFLYVDTVHILRNYPSIATLHRQYLEQSIGYVKGTLEYSVGSGNMRSEKVEGEYDRLAHALWMVMTFWLNQLEVAIRAVVILLSDSDILFILLKIIQEKLNLMRKTFLEPKQFGIKS